MGRRNSEFDLIQYKGETRRYVMRKDSRYSLFTAPGLNGKAYGMITDPTGDHIRTNPKGLPVDQLVRDLKAELHDRWDEQNHLFSKELFD